MPEEQSTTFPKLKVEMRKVSELVPYAANAKEHPEKQIDEIVNSIQTFSFNDPIACWHNEQGEPEVIEGHGRLMALRKMGIEQVPVIFLDHLTDEQRRAYTHVHNQTTLTSGFDEDLLWEDLATMDFEWSDFGFDIAMDDIEEYDEREAVDDEFSEDDVPSRVNIGDVWILGEHRLMCGDATSADDVSKLMDGSTADVCFTSPPYNMNVNPKFDSAPKVTMGAGEVYGEYADDKSDTEYAELLCGALDNALAWCDDAMFNVGVLAGSKHGLFEMVNTYADNLCDIVVWNKSTSMPHGMESQRGMLSHRCELIFCFNQNGSRSFSHPQWEKGTGINRIDTVNASGNVYAGEHSATFPVEFAYEVVKNFTESSVLDLFGGTGTTIIAAEQLDRKCYMMELDPHYCDIAIQRWEDFTGQKAVLDEGVSE